MSLDVRIAITATPGPPRPAPLLLYGDVGGAFRQAVLFGCQGVELHFRTAADVGLPEVKRLAARYRLGIPTVGTGMAAADGLSLSHPDPEVRARTIERVRGHVEFASEVGSAVTIGTLSGKLGDCTGEERHSRRARALESLAKLCDIAAAVGVTVLLEPLNRYECDYINTLADAMTIADEVGARNLKLLADTFHMNIEEVDLSRSLQAARSRLGHVHLADSNRQAPGHGHLDIGRVLETLGEIGYRGYLSFEVFPLPDPWQALRDGIETVHKALSRIEVAAG